MKANTNQRSGTESQSVGNETQTSQKEGAFQFKDNRPESALQRKVQDAMNNSSDPIQMKKDAADHDFGDKGNPEGTTATKVITPKNGSQGLFKYKYSDGEKILDSFQYSNIADESIAEGTEYEGLSAEEISTSVSSHDLTVDSGETSALTEEELTGGSRGVHFRHADAVNGTKDTRTNSYTWHHLQDKGKMELIDMNVHGAMWHYGGIDGWKAATHPPGDGEGTTDDDDA
ncbi:MAG: hypothetical protein Crog4KO_28920 [Crocinitomicaceae bacterium]